MEPSTHKKQPGFLKKINHSTHEFVLEISIIATILFCLNFWHNLPDLGIGAVWGKAIAAIGVLILFCMIAFRFKWPVLIGLVGLVIYLGISHLQSPENNTAKTNQTDLNSTQQGPGVYDVSTHYLAKDSVK